MRTTTTTRTKYTRSIVTTKRKTYFTLRAKGWTMERAAKKAGIPKGSLTYLTKRPINQFPKTLTN